MNKKYIIIGVALYLLPLTMIGDIVGIILVVLGAIGLIKKKRPVYARARVVWISKIELLAQKALDQYKIGLEFISLNSQDRNLLTKELRLYYE